MRYGVRVDGGLAISWKPQLAMILEIYLHRSNIIHNHRILLCQDITGLSGILQIHVYIYYTRSAWDSKRGLYIWAYMYIHHVGRCDIRVIDSPCQGRSWFVSDIITNFR